MPDNLVYRAHLFGHDSWTTRLRASPARTSLTNVYTKNLAVVTVNARVSPLRQCAAVRDRLCIGGRVIKIADHKFLAAHTNTISLAVAVVRLLMKNFNRAFDDLILSILIRVHQLVGMSEHERKIVEGKPAQTPNQNEGRPNVTFRTNPAFPIPNEKSQNSKKRTNADEQIENGSTKNAVTVSGNFKNGRELGHAEVNQPFSYLS